MRITIGTRIFVALTLVSVVVLALSITLMRLSFEFGFLNYVAEQEANALVDAAVELSDLYWRDGNWESLRDNPRRWNDLLRHSGRERRPPGRRPPPGPGPGGPPPDPLALGSRISLLDADGAVIVGPPPDAVVNRQVPIELNGEVVGTVSITPGRQLFNAQDENFAESQRRIIYVVGIAALIVAAVISAVVARQLTRPIRAVAAGAQLIAEGNFDDRIAINRNDELGDLASDFNQLAETLEKNRASRQRWVADIAHELRTPLAILRGELDALEDGIRSFDANKRQSLQAEVARLTRLVDDLHELSIYDEGLPDKQFEPVDVAELLQRMVGHAESRFSDAGIELSAALPDKPAVVLGDANRIEQLVANLFENSLRYTDAPGSLHVTCSATAAHVELRFADSGPGVPDGDLDRLFDRLFRVDTSRGRDTGGSGLGLSICKAIVEAHGGGIRAAHSLEGGLEIRLRLLPIEQVT